ncbi:MAG: hypothetical protein NVSMB24_06630 [Mucilaginibacter sp.]
MGDKSNNAPQFFTITTDRMVGIKIVNKTLNTSHLLLVDELERLLHESFISYPAENERQIKP